MNMNERFNEIILDDSEMEALASCVEDLLQRHFNTGSDSPRFFYDSDKGALQYSTPMYQWYYKYIRTRHLATFIQDIITLLLGADEYENTREPFDEWVLEHLDMHEGWYTDGGDNNEE